MAPFNPVNDPLGQLIALQQQAQEKRFGAAVDNPSTQVGPLPDPNWDAYFGAVNNAADGKPVNFAGSSGPDLGYDTNNGTTGPGTEQYGPRGMQFNKNPRLTGLQQATVQGQK